MASHILSKGSSLLSEVSKTLGKISSELTSSVSTITMTNDKSDVGAMEQIEALYKSSISSSNHSANTLKNAQELDPNLISKLSALGYSDYGSRASERDAIFAHFADAIVEQALTVRDGDAAAERLQLERFVIEMLKGGNSPQWADAAFRTFDYEGAGLNKYQFMLAVTGLRIDQISMANSQWVELRREIVFHYYDRKDKKSLTKEEFKEFLADTSVAINDEPLIYGISNRKWLTNLDENNKSTGLDSSDSMGKALAISRVALANKNLEYEELQLQYLKQEEKLVALKLLLAQNLNNSEKAGDVVTAFK